MCQTFSAPASPGTSGQIDALSPSRGTDQAGSNWFVRSRGLGGHSASSVALRRVRAVTRAHRDT